MKQFLDFWPDVEPWWGFSFLMFTRTIKYMKTVTGFLFILFTALTTSAADTSNCAEGKMTTKTKTNTVTAVANLCQNEYGQFFEKNCADGCEFAKALKSRGEVDIQDAVVGSPGGQICKELGFNAEMVDIEFKGKKIQNVDLCFTKDKFSYVSTGFLRDLEGDLEK